MLANQFKIGDKVRGTHKHESYKGIIVEIDSNYIYIDYPSETHFNCKIRDNGHVAAANLLDIGYDLELIKPITAKELNKQNYENPNNHSNTPKTNNPTLGRSTF